MNRRQFFFSTATAALAIRSAGRASEPPRSAPQPVSAPDLTATHEALFQFWFPLKKLKMPPAERSEIKKIASAVSAGMYQAFAESSLLGLLEGMTQPQLLPFYGELAGSPDPAVKAFLAIPGGFGAMPTTLRHPLFSFLFNGTAGPESTQLAMILREAYLSGIWGLPLAVPICKISVPKVFVDDPAGWARQHAPKLPPAACIMTPQRKAFTT